MHHLHNFAAAVQIVPTSTAPIRVQHVDGVTKFGAYIYARESSGTRACAISYQAGACLEAVNLVRCPAACVPVYNCMLIILQKHYVYMRCNVMGFISCVFSGTAFNNNYNNITYCRLVTFSA